MLEHTPHTGAALYTGPVDLGDACAGVLRTAWWYRLERAKAHHPNPIKVKRPSNLALTTCDISPQSTLMAPYIRRTNA